MRIVFIFNYTSMWKTKNMINEIMSNFDFDTVHKIMKLTSWEWFMSDSKRIPEIHEIRRFVKSYLDKIYDEIKITWWNKLTCCWWFEFEFTTKNWKVNEIIVKFVPLESLSVRK